MSSEGLGEILARLGPLDHPNLLAGAAGFEDAGVYRLDAERALVVTTDFFPPIVDDPRWFGRIAAANALSDVYAMGGRALTALNLVCWPIELELELLGEILAGGLEKIREAGAALCGGHSVQDKEIKYGLAVTGMVHPDRFWANAGAREGDVLLLTKPVGMGTVSTAIKKGLVSDADDVVQRAMVQMATLNRVAAEVAAGFEVHGATDVTGFGLIGHGREMAQGAGLTLVIDASAVPIFDGAIELSARGAVSGGGKRARAAAGPAVRVDPAVAEATQAMLFDAETSGGLMLAVPESIATVLQRRLAEAGTLAHHVIGRFTARGDVAVEIRSGG